MMEEDEDLAAKYKNGYAIKFEVDLESVFDLIPEINISQLAKSGKMNPGLLRQYVSGTKKASEKQAQKIMMTIQKLSEKLDSILITV